MCEAESSGDGTTQKVLTMELKMAQGRNPSLTGSFVPSSLDSGPTRLVTLSKVDSDAPLSSQKGVSIVISLKSIHPQTRQLNCITMNGKEQVDGVVGELTLEKRC